jgi:anti-repressor protein
MKDLKSFKSEFGEIRMTEQDGVPWFVAKDVCDALGLSNPTKAIKNLEDDERSNLLLGRQGYANCVNESGLYTLIIRSNKPNAKKFRRWVTSEVLPSIRKHGGYISGQESMNETELLQAALEVANRQIEEKNAQIEAMRPKVLFAEAVTQSEDSLPIGDFAKLLVQNGIKTGRNRLMEWLRNNGYLMKVESSKNRPTQLSIESGLFEMKETSTAHGDGHITMHTITRITGKGQLYFMDRFLKKGEVR